MAEANPIVRGSRFKDIAGMKFDRLTVLRYSGQKNKDNRLLWLCKCECGNTGLFTGKGLRNGTIQSCGCLHRERISAGCHTTHGLCHTPEHVTWVSMKARCNNPKTKSFPRYGGRGIKICARWSDFINFYNDMGPKPGKNYSIERKDNDGDYCPENCIWIPMKTQALNRRSTKKITFRNESMTAGEWSKVTGVSEMNIRQRIAVYGWSAERALTTTEDGRLHPQKPK